MDESDKQSHWNRADLWCVLLAFATLAAYWQTGACGFINYDDDLYVTENPRVLAGLTWGGFLWAFANTTASNWHPLTWLSHMLDVQLFGANAGAHHVVNVVLHIASAVLLLLVLRRMTGALGRSAFVAALFALHPLHVESVAWVAERKDVLSGLFWMLTLWAYARYVERPRAGRYALVALFLALGLMAKPVLVTLPFVLLLLDYWPLNRLMPVALPADAPTASPPPARVPFKRLLVEKIPLLALALAASAVTFLVQQKEGAVGTLEKYSLAARVANALVAYVRYLGKMICPEDLSVFYPHPGAWAGWQMGGAAVALLVITLATLAVPRRYLLVGWLWFLGTLVPMIGLVQVGFQAMADRYTYLPLIGPFVMISWGVAELAGKWPRRNILLGAASAVVLAGCLVATWRQVRHWQNSVTLFTHALSVTRNNLPAHYNLGKAHFMLGEMEPAIAQFNAVLRLDPKDEVALNNLGGAFHRLGLYAQSTNVFAELLRLNPDNAAAHFNRGVSLMALGDFPLAATHFAAAARLNPGYPTPPLNLGKMLLRLGQPDQAAAAFAEALRRNPGYAEAHSQLGLLLVTQGKTPDGLAHLRESLRLRPDSPEVLNNLAWLLATHPDAAVRDGPQAIRLAQRACELTAQRAPNLLGTLAAAYAEAGQFTNAVQTAAQAIALAEAAGQAELAAANKKLQTLYQSGQPWREGK